MPFEDGGQETRRDNIGVGMREEMLHQFRMAVEEDITRAAVVGKHQSFPHLSAHSNANDGRQEAPSRTAMDMQYVILPRHTAESQRQQQTPQESAPCREDLCSEPLGLQISLQQLHLPRDAAHATSVVAKKKYLHIPRLPSLKNAQAKAITGTIQYHILMNL